VVGALLAFLVHHDNTGNRRLGCQYLIALSVCLADLIQFLNGRTGRHRIDARQGIRAQRSSVVKLALGSRSDAVELGERLASDLLDVLPGFSSQLHAQRPPVPVCSPRTRDTSISVYSASCDLISWSC